MVYPYYKLVLESHSIRKLASVKYRIMSDAAISTEDAELLYQFINFRVSELLDAEITRLQKGE